MAVAKVCRTLCKLPSLTTKVGCLSISKKWKGEARTRPSLGTKIAGRRTGTFPVSGTIPSSDFTTRLLPPKRKHCSDIDPASSRVPLPSQVSKRHQVLHPHTAPHPPLSAVASQSEPGPDSKGRIRREIAHLSQPTYRHRASITGRPCLFRCCQRSIYLLLLHINLSRLLLSLSTYPEPSLCLHRHPPDSSQPWRRIHSSVFQCWLPCVTRRRD